MAEKSNSNPSESIPCPEAEGDEMTRRRFLKGGALVAAGAGIAPMLLSGTEVHVAPKQPGCSEWTQPTDTDFVAIVGKDKAEFIDRVLDVLENEVVPRTMKGVRAGNKLFAAAILNKSDLSTVIATTNA